MTVNNNYPYAPQNVSDTNGFLRLLKETINFVMNGKTNNTGEVTLTANAASTTVNNILCNANSVILMTPVAANAAADFGSATGVYVVAGAGSFVITHPNNANANKNVKYVIIG